VGGEGAMGRGVVVGWFGWLVVGGVDFDERSTSFGQFSVNFSCHFP
jgi:hypothetical protein